MSCKSCPFNFSEESEYAQNTGCLPSAYDIINLKRETGHNWACHSNPLKMCKGLIEDVEERKLDLDLSKGGLIWRCGSNAPFSTLPLNHTNVPDLIVDRKTYQEIL